MLSKLIKYELKATGRLFLPVFLSLLVVAVINKLLFLLNLNPGSNFPASLSMVIYVMIMVAMFVMSMIVMMQRFYSNLLSDEGYLMFTLPTKTWKLIASKLVVSIFWIIASLAVAFLSLLILSDLDLLIEGFHWFYNPFEPSFYTLTLELLIAGLLTLALGIVLVYASIAIGHLFSKHKILASFGAFIALNTLSQILFVFYYRAAAIAWPLIKLPIPEEYFVFSMHFVILYAILFTGLLSAACFAVTNYILSKKLNLE